MDHARYVTFFSLKWKKAFVFQLRIVQMGLLSLVTRKMLSYRYGTVGSINIIILE